MKPNNVRETRRLKKERQKRKKTLLWTGGLLAVLALVGFGIWQAVQPSPFETIPIMDNYTIHVPEGQDPGPYNSNPPSSGPHYDAEYEAGFYDETSPEAQATYPEGYIGHNLEHGYVIYWYNCTLLSEDACSQLKDEIQSSMAENGGAKLIAFPRASIEEPVAMSSWGQILRMDAFDPDLAKQFVQSNRNKAPEPNAP